MKKIIILSMIALGLTAITSCNNNLDFENGGAIRFGVATGYYTGPDTKTTYTGEDEDGNTITSNSDYERIDWLGTDTIRIISPQASVPFSENKYADYNVVPASADASRASIVPATGNGLNWGEGNHTFFAVYPSPEQNEKLTITLDGTRAMVSASIPAVQEVTLEPGTRNFKPDMDYAYMIAAKSNVSPGSDVELEFKPLVNTFEFSLLAHPDDPMGTKVTRLRLTSGNTQSLSGDFNATIFGSGTISVAPQTNLKKYIDIALPDGGVMLSSNPAEAYTVTFFCIPQNYTNLSLTLYFENDVPNSTSTKPLERIIDIKQSNGDLFTFPRFSKSYIWKLAAPRTVYVFSQLPTFDLQRNVSGAWSSQGEFGWRSLVSRTKDYNDPISFKALYSDSVNGPWVETCPDWLVPRKDELAGVTSVFYYVKPNVEVATIVDRASVHTEALKRKAIVSDFDLSTINVATGETVSTTTANCYVVQAPGTYRFPLVYGNSLKAGTVNDAAFHRQQETATGEHYLGYYLDHYDEPITNTGNDPEEGEHYTKNSIYIAERFAGKSISASLLWTDAEGLVNENSISVSGTGQNAYITFEVPQSTICQGNAVIAVKVGGVIAWSWHIWVTDANMKEFISAGDAKFPKVNLGWCETQFVTYPVTSDRSVYVKFVQSISGKESTPHKISQPGNPEELTLKVGNNPYYQWGRKDPLLAIMDRAEFPSTAPVYKTFYGPKQPQKVTSRSTIGNAIKNPNVFYYPSHASGFNWTPDTINYHNLWNSSIEGVGDSYVNARVSKTIYDPSPVGFKVPNPGSISALGDAVVVGHSFIPGMTISFMNGIIEFPCVSGHTNGAEWMWNGAMYWTASAGSFEDSIRAYCFNSIYIYGPEVTSRFDKSFLAAIRPIQDVE